MRRLRNNAVGNRMRRFLALGIMLTLILSQDVLVLAEEIRDKGQEKVEEWKEEQQAEETRRQQQEYIEENKAGASEETEDTPDSPGGHTEQETDTGTEKNVKSNEEIPSGENAGWETVRQPELEGMRADELEACYGEPAEVYEYGKVFQTGEGSYKFMSTQEPNL